MARHSSSWKNTGSGCIPPISESGGACLANFPKPRLAGKEALLRGGAGVAAWGGGEAAAGVPRADRGRGGLLERSTVLQGDPLDTCGTLHRRGHQRSGRTSFESLQKSYGYFATPCRCCRCSRGSCQLQQHPASTLTKPKAIDRLWSPKDQLSGAFFLRSQQIRLCRRHLRWR